MNTRKQERDEQVIQALGKEWISIISSFFQILWAAEKIPVFLEN